MMHRRIAACLSISTLTLVSLACGLENIQFVESPNLALTVTAQALALQQGAPASAQRPTASPIAASATSGDTTATVSVETNCRTGPGLAYPGVYSLPIGTSAEVIGKNTITNYWIIKIPGSGGTCWLWGKYATVRGSSAALIEYATPTAGAATPTVGSQESIPLDAPTGMFGTIACQALDATTTHISGTLAWADTTNNETGYSVEFLIPVSNPIVGLPANTTSLEFSFDLLNSDLGSALTYNVARLTPNGPSAVAWNTIGCQ